MVGSSRKQNFGFLNQRPCDNCSAKLTAPKLAVRAVDDFTDLCRLNGFIFGIFYFTFVRRIMPRPEDEIFTNGQQIVQYVVLKDYAGDLPYFLTFTAQVVTANDAFATVKIAQRT